MTLDDFRRSLAPAEPPADLTCALAGLWWDAKGDWTKAHESAQQDEGHEGSWVHAYLHRKEGDQDNAAYWYGRAGKPVCEESLDVEWLNIVRDLLKTQPSRFVTIAPFRKGLTHELTRLGSHIPESPLLREVTKFVKYVNSHRGSPHLSALEAIFIDIHRSDLRLQSRWRNAELSRGTRRSRHPASRLSQGCANHFSILGRRSPEERLA